MKTAKIIRAFGLIDDKFLIEAEDAASPQKPRFKIKPVLIAAAISVLALSTTAFSISRASALENMKYAFDHYSGIKSETEQTEIPAEYDLTPEAEQDYTFFNGYTDSELKDPVDFPWIENLAEYGDEFEYDTEQKPDEFRLTSVLMDDHCFYATMQYVIPDDVKKELGKKLPEGAVPWFRIHFQDGGGYEDTYPISLEGNLYTFTIYSLGFSSLPDEITVTFRDFGYREMEDGQIISDFQNALDFERTLTVSTSKLKKTESKISGEEVYHTESGDVYMTAELSPTGIFLNYHSEDGIAASELYDDKYFLPNKLQICLDDGRIYGDGETFFELFYILNGRSGNIINYNDGDPENDLVCESLTFKKPVDISHIEKIIIGGCEFIFD